ncbi:hypothetical protein [Nocardioides sp. T2.26MG-1]|uniref:hypothetical protein n=1 Tax=Nocardioides sp. T2.26MG-1 TaxID=3041166 RepID=UPI0024775D0B|nr:hypothetical protein [Nocardioides sp. T2.26MG-1]CAI9409502.1 hypothetical protein HIDPHFAB_01300 [Nocardioides sp. T2.26MG-1]
MRTRTGVALLGVAAVGVAAAVGYGVLDHVAPLLQADECTATVNGRTVSLTPEQAENAALITAVSVGRGLPARAATIALATAYQESKLYNVESGDRDSLGLFQQRPSMGWGSEEQVLDPFYATNAFYDALEKIGDYESMRVTVAAQEVQRSGFPEAYADHEADARVLASALTGNSKHAFSCRIGDAPEPESDRLKASGLTHRADVVRREVGEMFGDPPLGGFEPGGVTTGHMEGSAHYEGRAVDIFVRPVNADNKVRGWAIAQYLVAMADRLGIQHVIFDDRIWTSGSSSDEGWRDYDPPERSGDRAILEHRDHVHVDVFD